MGTVKRKKVGSYKPKQENVQKLTQYLKNINNKKAKNILL